MMVTEVTAKRFCPTTRIQIATQSLSPTTKQRLSVVDTRICDAVSITHTPFPSDHSSPPQTAAPALDRQDGASTAPCRASPRNWLNSSRPVVERLGCELDPDAVRHAYEILADTYADEFGDDLHQSSVDSMVLDGLIEMLPARPLVLDLGCGPAQVASYVTTRGCRAIGVDLTPAMLASARCRAPAVALVNANMLELPIRDARRRRRRVVLTPQPAATTPRRGARRGPAVLRPGGVFVMVTHAGHGEEFITVASSERTEQVVITYYEVDELRALLGHHQLEVVDIQKREPLDHEHAVPKLLVTATSQYRRLPPIAGSGRRIGDDLEVGDVAVGCLPTR